MRLFLKHWLRTVRRSPWQPLLLLLTVTLSVALAVTAFRMQFLFEDISEQASKDETELGDVILSMKGNSQIRLLFTEDVEQALGEDSNAQILGEYSLTAFYETETGTQLLALSGVDFEKADRYFSFQYTEYGSFHSQNLKQAAILSKEMASQNGISVGDTVVLRLMGEEMTYTVQAIAEGEGLLKERDVLISISGLVDVLAKKIPAISAMGTQFEPYNRILLEFEDSNEAETAVEKLSNSPLFSDKQMTLAESQTRENFLLFMQRSATSLIAIILLLLCGLLIATSLQLLQIKRSADSAFFYSVGATKGQLHAMQYIENGLYALLGGIGGVCLAYPLLNGAWDFFSMPQESVSVGPLGTAFGIGVAMLLMLGCTAFSLRGEKRLTIAEWVQKEETLKRPGEGKWMWLPFASLTAIILLVMVLVPLKWKYLPGIFAIGFFTVFLYFSLPLLLHGFAGITEKILSKRKKPSAFWLLATKNLKQQFALRHVGRLLTVLLSILVLVSFCAGAIQTQLDRFEKAFVGDLIAANAPKNTEEELGELPYVTGVARFDMVTTAQFLDEYTAMAILASGDLTPILHSDFIPNQMPSVSEVVISRGVAILADVEVGELFTLTLDGATYTLTVSEIQDIQTNFIFLNKAVVPGTRDLLGISLSEEAKGNSALQAEIYQVMEAQGVVLFDPESLKPSSYRLLLGFSDLLQYATYTAIIVSLSGCINLFAGQIRARKKEREILRMCGMTRGGILKLYVTELLLLSIPILLLGILCGVGMSLLMNYGLHSFGITLFFF